MLQYAARRILATLPIALLAITLAFFVMRLAPGGPFDGVRPLPPAVLENVRAYYNLDKSLIEQYFHYVGGLLQGDFGPSMSSYDFSVSELLALGLPFTLMLGFIAFVIATVVGVVVGTLAAAKQ